MIHNYQKYYAVLPVLPSLWGSVTLASVLEPVWDLDGRQPGHLGQLTFVPGRGVGVDRVPVLQHRARLLAETVRGLLAVPDSPRKWKLSPGWMKQHILILHWFFYFQLIYLQTYVYIVRTTSTGIISWLKISKEVWIQLLLQLLAAAYV